MATETEAFSALLVQLDRIAKAPMTGQERELRAKSVLDTLKVGDVAGVMTREELGWNAAKASEHGVRAALWLRAVEVADLPKSKSAAELLDRMHRADAIVEMLKAGYAAGVDPLPLIWSGRG